MTILVLAPELDETAARFAEFACRSGVPAVVTSGFERASVSVRAERDRAHRVRLTVDGTPVRGVLNRGLGGGPADDFVRSEALAVWWSALALWDGPVANRPTRQGFLPVAEDPGGHRFLLAGTKPFDLAGELPAAETARLPTGLGDEPRFATFAMVEGEARWTSCWPDEHEFAGLADAVYSALLEELDR